MPFTAPSGIQGIFQKLGGSFGLFEKGGNFLVDRMPQLLNRPGIAGGKKGVAVLQK